MSGTATKRQTTTKSSGSGSAKQATQAEQGLTIDELERQQQEVEQAIAAKRQQERDQAWEVLGAALPKAARGEAFDGQAVKAAIQVVGLSFEQFKCDAQQYRSSVDDPAGKELAAMGLDDHALSQHIRSLVENAQKALHEAKCEAGRLRGLVTKRSHRRQSLRGLKQKGYRLPE